MENNQESPSVFHSLVSKDRLLKPQVVLFLIILVVLGIGGGYFLASQQAGGSKAATGGSPASSASVQKGVVYGSNDTTTFKDTADGVVTVGGINGEGQYHLVRPGGDSQNVYMTSSLVDLSLFTGKKVKVWGQTQKAQTAGWLMDVGRVEVE